MSTMRGRHNHFRPRDFQTAGALLSGAMTSPQPHDLIAVRETVEGIARKAGEGLRAAYARPRKIDYKGDIDLVTQADLEAEAAIVSALQAHFPAHAILAEESAGSVHEASTPTWVIDPLDGTTNFAHGFPVFAVSIALIDSREPLVGVVYDPLRDELFSAARGHGAALNGTTIRVSQIDALRRALLATGFPYDRHVAEDNNTDSFRLFIRRSQGVRRAGAAALDLAYVACGRLDGFWELRLHPWDVGAGILLVREAGGVVTDYAGSPGSDLLLQGAQIVASNGHIHAEMLGVLHELYEGHM
jgi:myo-inositol-1(or 4)-monophosphatase